MFLSFTQVVLTDITNKVILKTSDSGQTMQQINVEFHPSDVLFHDTDPFTFLVYDKVDPLKKVFNLINLVCFQLFSKEHFGNYLLFD